MTTQNLKVEQWALERGLRTPFNGGVSLIHNGNNLSVGFVAQGGFAVTAVLADKKPDKSLIKNVTKELKGLGKVIYNASTHWLQFIYKVKNKNDFSNITDQAIAAFSNALSSNGLRTEDLCTYCGRSGTDSGVEKGPGVIVPAHSACKQQHVSDQLTKIADNQANGNYVLGTIGALLGALVGVIPIVIMFMIPSNEYYPYLFVVIPLACGGGYRLFKGIANKYMIFVTGLISMLVGVIAYPTALYFSIVGELDFEYYIPAMLDYFQGAYYLEDMENVIFILVCLILGVAMTWGSVARTNKRQQKELQQMAAQDAYQGGIVPLQTMNQTPPMQSAQPMQTPTQPMQTMQPIQPIQPQPIPMAEPAQPSQQPVVPTEAPEE